MPTYMECIGFVRDTTRRDPSQCEAEDKRKVKVYQIMSVHKQPDDAFSIHGDVFNVAITVQLFNPYSDGTDPIPADIDYPI